MGTLFDLVLASAFYDGAEEGVAFSHDGRAMAFWTIADSPFRIFRAYYFRPMLDLDAARQFAAEARTVGKQFAFIESGEEWATDVGPVDQVGVGHPYLDWLHLAPATAAEVAAIEAVDSEAERYRRAHRHVKRFGLGKSEP